MKDVIAEFERLTHPETRKQRAKDRRVPERKTRGISRWKLVEVAGQLRWYLLGPHEQLIGFAYSWPGSSCWYAVLRRHGMDEIVLIGKPLLDCVARIMRGLS